MTLDTIPYAAGLMTAGSTMLAQVHPNTGWSSLVIQAGMAGVVVLLLLKFFPMILSHLDKTAQENREIIRDIIQANQNKDKEWQKIISDKGICPKDKNQ